MANKKYLTLPELNQVEPHLDSWMYETQRLYEEAVQKYIVFKENHINCIIKYDNKLADEIQKLKGEKYKVTIIKEIAQKECADEYKDMLLAEAQKKKYTMWVSAMQERINMLKYLMKRKYSD